MSKLDNINGVFVYAKILTEFLILTPVVDYNLEKTISFKDDRVCHIYANSVTKGGMPQIDLRQIDMSKTDNARQ